MAWFVVYRTADGSAVSIGDSVAADLPAGLAVKQFATRPDQGGVWNPATLAFDPIPATTLVDRVQDLLTSADPTYAGFAAAYTKLTAAQKGAVQNAVVKLLGGRRMRPSTEAIEIDPPAGS